jgi:hypothetical protein
VITPTESWIGEAMWNCCRTRPVTACRPSGAKCAPWSRTEGLGAVDAGNIYGTYQAQGKVRKFVKKLTSSAERTESEHSAQRRLPPFSSQRSVPESKHLSPACAG